MPQETESTSPTPETSEAPARCVRCGYSLLGVSGERCPECGFAVGGTSLLRGADLRWLRTIVLGGRLVRVGAIGGLIFAMMPQPWVAWAFARLGADVSTDGQKLLMRCALFASFGTAILGTWFITEPDPYEDEAHAGSFRQRPSVLRYALAGVVAILAARLAFDRVLPPTVGALMSLAALGLGLTALRGIGDIVQRLVARCATASAGEAKTAGRAGAWIFWVIVIIACVIGVNTRIFSSLSSQRVLAVTARVMEMMVAGFGAFAAALAMFSLARPMHAIRAEFDLARCRRSLGDT